MSEEINSMVKHPEIIEYIERWALDEIGSNKNNISLFYMYWYLSTDIVDKYLEMGIINSI